MSLNTVQMIFDEKDLSTLIDALDDLVRLSMIKIWHWALAGTQMTGSMRYS